MKTASIVILILVINAAVAQSLDPSIQACMLHLFGFEDKLRMIYDNWSTNKYVGESLVWTLYPKLAEAEGLCTIQINTKAYWYVAQHFSNPNMFRELANYNCITGLLMTIQKFKELASKLRANFGIVITNELSTINSYVELLYYTPNLTLNGNKYTYCDIRLFGRYFKANNLTASSIVKF